MTEYKAIYLLTTDTTWIFNDAFVICFWLRLAEKVIFLVCLCSFPLCNLNTQNKNILLHGVTTLAMNEMQMFSEFLQMTGISAKHPQIKTAALWCHFTPKKIMFNTITKIIYFIILRQFLVCIQLCTFSNILTSIIANSWGPFEIVFFSHYTESIFQIHFISLSAIQNLLRKRHCWGDSLLQALGLCLAWLLRAAEFTKTLPRNEETSGGDVKPTSWLLLWSSPFFLSPDVQEKKETNSGSVNYTQACTRPFGIIMEAESI